MPWKTLRDGRKVFISTRKYEEHRENPYEKYMKRRSEQGHIHEQEWNHSTYERRKIILANAGIDKDEREFASHSSWDELSPSSRKKILES